MGGVAMPWWKGLVRLGWAHNVVALCLPPAVVALLVLTSGGGAQLGAKALAAVLIGGLLLGGAHLCSAARADARCAGLERDLLQLRRQFEQQILARASALMAANEEELQSFAQAVAALERELTDRTVQLEAANQELEAFAYSVSHDLRAPLERVDAFSSALLEDYGKVLDGQGRDYLQRVRSGSRHMGRLIDAILKLSRLTRGEMHRERVDLSHLARLVAADLERSEPRREVRFAIHPNLVTDGDPELLKVALDNLLGNAWKFTGPRPGAEVEFGTLSAAEAAACGRGEQAVYFVRDNGVGFDMAYAGKLFAAFQRLHREADFPGTGIGLATVQRIVHRHGGEIWAEGKVDRGATFYFTL